MERKETILLNLIVFCAFAFSLAFALTNPPFEAPDEPAHLDYINFVVKHWTLPYQYDDNLGTNEGHQHPLYYFLVAPVVAAAQSGQPIQFQTRPGRLSFQRDDVPRFNRQFTRFASGGDMSAFYLLRVINAVFAAVAVLFVSLSARLVIPNAYALFAGAFVATLPQFQFISGSVSNDALTACLGCASLYALLRAGLTKKDWKSWAWAGFWVGMAVLAKKSNLFIVPAALLWIFVFPLAEGEAARPARMRALGIFTGVLLAACGWLFVRNLVTYHDLLGTRMERDTLQALVHPKSITDPYFHTYFERITARTFFAHFGWMNVTVSLVFIVPLVLILFAGLAASWKGLKEQALKGVWWFAAAWVVLSVAGLFYYNMTYTQPQGRLLFPALAPLGLLFGAGMWKLLGRLEGRKAQIAICAFALILLAIDIAALMINIRFYGRPGF